MGVGFIIASLQSWVFKSVLCILTGLSHFGENMKLNMRCTLQISTAYGNVSSQEN